MDGSLGERQMQKQMNGAPAPIRLWNPIGFLILSSLFSFLPGAILCAINWGRLGYTRKRNLFIPGSILAFATFCVIAYFIPEGFLAAFYFALNFGVGSYLMQSQLKAYKAHIESGGKKASFLIPLAVCIGISALVIWILIMAESIPQDKLMFGTDQLYYTEKVQVEDAQALGEYLTEIGLFADDGQPILVKLDQEENIYIVSLAVKKEALDEVEIMAVFQEMKNRMSENLFDGNVRLVLSDNKFQPLKTLE